MLSYFIICIICLWHCVRSGWQPRQRGTLFYVLCFVLVFFVFFVFCIFVFYLFIRSGWQLTQRGTPAGTGWQKSLAWREPSRFSMIIIMIILIQWWWWYLQISLDLSGRSMHSQLNDKKFLIDLEKTFAQKFSVRG